MEYEPKDLPKNVTGEMRCQLVGPDGLTAGERRIAELETASRSALSQLNTIMNIRMPRHAAGALVHAREVLKSVTPL